MTPTRYDFRKPVRLPASWQQRLAGWFGSAATLANRAWSKQLPVPLQLSVGALDSTYAKEGLAALAATDLGYRVMVAGDKLPTFLVWPRLLVLQVLGVLLGDTAAVTDHELTLVEDNLADYFLVNLWLPFFREAWPGTGLVPWQLTERETEPQGSRFFAARDVLLVLPWQITGPWGASKGLWFFQQKGILQTLGTGERAAGAAIDEGALAVRKKELIGSLPLRVEFVLGTADLRLSELSGLQVGDVLVLDQRKEEGATAATTGQALFRGAMGRVGSWKAFRIEALMEK
jgi:flagellar motor switch protein FliM